MQKTAGQRTFLITSILILITAALHTMGHFAPPSEDAELNLLQAAMEATRLSFPLDMKPSILGVMKSLSLTMSILLSALGFANLIILRRGHRDPGLMRIFIHFNQIVCLALVATYSYFQVFPPLVCMVVICLVLGLAQWQVRGSRG